MLWHLIKELALQSGLYSSTRELEIFLNHLLVNFYCTWPKGTVFRTPNKLQAIECHSLMTQACYIIIDASQGETYRVKDVLKVYQTSMKDNVFSTSTAEIELLLFDFDGA